MPPLAPSAELKEAFGDIDIYLFDQILRGRFDTRRRVLDAGCGDGRNLRYLLHRGFDCYGLDEAPRAVEHVRTLASALAPTIPTNHFVVGTVDHLPWADASMDVVLCSAVLHFANDVGHWERMVEDLWRVTAPGGLLFARLASNIGLEHILGPGGRRLRLPDGSDRFIVDEPQLMAWTARLGGRLADPLKTTVVQGMRAMTTWCLFKA